MRAMLIAGNILFTVAPSYLWAQPSPGDALAQCKTEFRRVSHAEGAALVEMLRVMSTQRIEKIQAEKEKAVAEANTPEAKASAVEAYKKKEIAARMEIAVSTGFAGPMLKAIVDKELAEVTDLPSCQERLAKTKPNLEKAREALAKERAGLH